MVKFTMFWKSLVSLSACFLSFIVNMLVAISMAENFIVGSGT